jgi:alkylation response protein AidB-like acyl-CoA dehydrogenase
VLEEAYGWVQKYLGRQSLGDEVGCKLENGQVRAPAGFREAWQELYKAGWRTARDRGEARRASRTVLARDAGRRVHVRACTSFNMYPALTQGAADVIVSFGTPEQQATYVPNMMNGAWAGTMCLTEPHAGSDVGSAATIAKRRDDGKYNIQGTKIFISGGDQDMTTNIVHMVLARTSDAPPGTKGLSLFIVPKVRARRTATTTSRSPASSTRWASRASSTAQLVFGEDGNCIGELVGTVEQKGISADVPPHELRAYRRRSAGRSRSRRAHTSMHWSMRRTASRAAR